MSDSLALTLTGRGPPATLEAMALFRVPTAGLHGPPAPASASASVVMLTADDGGVVVYPPSQKLVILSEARERLRPAKDAVSF